MKFGIHANRMSWTSQALVRVRVVLLGGRRAQAECLRLEFSYRVDAALAAPLLARVVISDPRIIRAQRNAVLGTVRLARVGAVVGVVDDEVRVRAQVVLDTLSLAFVVALLRRLVS
ncbi:hypothetical protein T35B1_04863 [Salinisphaera shabanensis T35B1]